MNTCAREVAVGDVIRMRTGDVEVLGLWGTHGGVEAKVRPAGSTAQSEDAGARILWFWPRQSVARVKTLQAPMPTLPARPPKGAAANRESVSRRVRFEVFKRDGFRCVYCGATPVDKPLHVDHVEARANGGNNDPSNLVTACPDCNLGKSAVPLDRKTLSTSKVTEADRDHADQIREFLAIQREVLKAKASLGDEAAAFWEETTGDAVSPTLRVRLPTLVAEWGLEKLVEAFGIVGAKSYFDGPGRYEDRKVKYLYGILRKWREARGQ